MCTRKRHSLSPGLWSRFYFQTSLKVSSLILNIYFLYMWPCERGLATFTLHAHGQAITIITRTHVSFQTCPSETCAVRGATSGHRAAAGF